MMKNILEKYVLDADDIFDDAFEFENDKIKKEFSNLIDNLPTVKPNEWFELLCTKEELYISASIGTNEAYSVLISKIIHGYSKKIKYQFFLCNKTMYFLIIHIV